MTAPNRATLWGRTIVDELAAGGVDLACLAPGSRSTPLTVAAAEHADVETASILDERSCGFFALGYGRRTGTPAVVVCTSGTAAANFHPAVIEAHQSNVPLVVLTADRPAELQDSGANQTIDQTDLYGDAVRFQRTLPEPAPEARRLRSVRTTVARAIGEATGADPGPVHLNVPVAKPLEPVEADGDIPDSLAAEAPAAVEERSGPFVQTATGRGRLDDQTVSTIASEVSEAGRGLVVVGPRNPDSTVGDAIARLSAVAGFPVLADPLSGLRFGEHVAECTVCGGYDSYLDTASDWPDPDVVLRFGASPTSKTLRHYLRDADARQFVVDPGGDWPEAEFTATDHLVADPGLVATDITEQIQHSKDQHPVDQTWADRFRNAETAHWSVVESGRREQFFEGGVLATVVEDAPNSTTLYVSNSMPVRDCDRFGRPREADLTVLGNRGASGIDGVVSSALGAGMATGEPLVLVIGDLAYYHDMNGLLSVARCDVDATIVLVNNDGGGIFHMLPIAEFDPPFTEQFRTPHGLDFEPSSDLYGLEYERVSTDDAFESAYREAVGSGETTVIEVVVDAESSHRHREQLHERVGDHLD